MALGAQTAKVVRMIVGQGARLTAIGLVFGVAAAILLGRVLASQIVHVRGFDLMVLAGAVAGLSLTAL